MDSYAFRQLFLSRMAKQRSPLAFVFRLAARIPRLRSRAVRAICQIEGGQMWSSTYRELMRQHYDVVVGMHSYGPSLNPDGLPEGTRVGNYCSLAAGITVFRRNHPTERFCQHPFFYNAATGLLEDDAIDAVRDHPLIIENDVWIGARAIITPRCRSIGLGAVIGAGAVVTKDVPPFAILAGVPARKIGERFSSEIQQVLTECRWWEYSVDHLIPLLPLFLEAATLDGARRLQAHLHASSPAQ